MFTPLVTNSFTRGTACTCVVELTQGQEEGNPQFSYQIGGFDQSEIDIPLFGSFSYDGNSRLQFDIPFTPLTEPTWFTNGAINIYRNGVLKAHTGFTVDPIRSNTPSSNVFWSDVSNPILNYTSSPANGAGVDWISSGNSLSVTPKSALTSFNGNLAAFENSPKGYLDARGCNSLQTLNLRMTEIRDLNLADCALLTYIDCAHSCLAYLNLQNCVNLTQLHLQGSFYLKTLNISNLTSLTTIDFQNSSKLTNIVGLNSVTSLQSLNIGATNMPSLNVSGLTSLKALNCRYATQLQGNVTGLSSFSTADEGNYIGFSSCNMSAAHLNNIFNQLPTKGSSITNDWTIAVPGNPGTNTANIAIAQNKGWIVQTTGF